MGPTEHQIDNELLTVNFLHFTLIGRAQNCILNLSGTFVSLYNNSNDRSVTEEASIEIILHLSISVLLSYLLHFISFFFSF